MPILCDAYCLGGSDREKDNVDTFETSPILSISLSLSLSTTYFMNEFI